LPESNNTAHRAIPYNEVGYKVIKWNVHENGGPDKDGKYPSYKDWNGANYWFSSVKRGNH
jgi:hypothetical protein